MNAEPQPARRRVEVLNRQGLHARPASVLVQHAKAFASEIVLVLVEAPDDAGAEAGTRVDAKNVLDVMFLAAPQGTRLDVEAVGPDAEAAVNRLAALFLSQFNA